MKTAKAVGLLLDLLLLAASLTTGGSNAIRTIAVLVAAIVGGLVVVCAVFLTLGVLAQRQPPYPMIGGNR